MNIVGAISPNTYRVHNITRSTSQLFSEIFLIAKLKLKFWIEKKGPSNNYIPIGQWISILDIATLNFGIVWPVSLDFGNASIARTWSLGLKITLICWPGGIPEVQLKIEKSWRNLWKSHLRYLWIAHIYLIRSVYRGPMIFRGSVE